MNNLIKVIFLMPIVLALVSTTYALEPATSLPPVGTKATLGSVGGIEIETIVQSPSEQETALQVVCLFEYTEGDIFNSPPALPKELNGLLNIDVALHGLITEIRKTNKFEGKFLETLLIIPPANTILAKKLLLIGLGNRNDFIPENMRLIGITGMREALRLGVSQYSHASDIKDAGISSSTSDVTGYVITGAIEAYRSQEYLRKLNASDPLTVIRVTLLTGPAYFKDSNIGIIKAIETLSK